MEGIVIGNGGFVKREFLGVGDDDFEGLGNNLGGDGGLAEGFAVAVDVHGWGGVDGDGSLGLVVEHLGVVLDLVAPGLPSELVVIEGGGFFDKAEIDDGVIGLDVVAPGEAEAGGCAEGGAVDESAMSDAAESVLGTIDINFYFVATELSPFFEDIPHVGEAADELFFVGGGFGHDTGFEANADAEEVVAAIEFNGVDGAGGG